LIQSLPYMKARTSKGRRISGRARGVAEHPPDDTAYAAASDVSSTRTRAVSIAVTRAVPGRSSTKRPPPCRMTSRSSPSWVIQTTPPMEITVAPAANFYFSHYDQMVHAAIEGQGVALGRSPLLEDFLRAGKLVALFGRSALSNRAYFVAMSRPRPTGPSCGTSSSGSSARPSRARPTTRSGPQKATRFTWMPDGQSVIYLRDFKRRRRGCRAHAPGLDNTTDNGSRDAPPAPVEPQTGNRSRRPRALSGMRSAASSAGGRSHATSSGSARAHCPTLPESAVYEFLRGERQIGLEFVEALLAAVEIEVRSRDETAPGAH